VAGTQNVIKGVDAGGRDPDQDLLRFRNRIRPVEELLDLRAAELAEPERLTHCQLLSRVAGVGALAPPSCVWPRR
jgi:hypothetical protein